MVWKTAGRYFNKEGKFYFLLSAYDMHSSKHNFINSFLSFFKEIIKRPTGILGIVFVALLVFLLLFLFPVISKKTEEPLMMVRVRIAHNEKSVKVGLNDKFKIEGIDTSEVLKDEIFPGGEISVSNVPGGIKVGRETFNKEGIRFSSYGAGG